MSPKRALQLALSFLKSFQEAGSIYDDYIGDVKIGDEQYSEMLVALEKLATEAE
jgi:hypothetical protein